jgi:hypothetical protein
MTFLNPAFLYALGAAALPLLLHLVRRRRLRVIQWAAWQFLLASQQKLRRRLRLEQMLLAIIRAMIVALIALAFARPVIRSRASARGGGGPIHAVIALDNSASMGFQRSGRSDFDRARDAAEAIVARTLKQGDTVSVVLISSAPRPLIKHPSHDLEAARKAIRAAELSGLGTRYEAAGRMCLDLCGASRASRKEVYVITDSQRSGFSKAPSAAASEIWQRLGRMARITWINVADAERPDAAVLAPTISRALVTPGVPVRLEAEIANRTGAALDNVVVRLEVDGRPAGASAITVRNGGTAVASFTHSFAAAGVRTGKIVLDRPDGLATDNVGWFALRVRPALRVLVVGPASSSSGAPDALYPATALAPTSASEGPASNVTVTVRSSLSDAGRLTAYDAVILAGPNLISSAEAQAVLRYVTGGGALLAFPGAGGVGGLAALWTDSVQPVLPARLVARRVHPLNQAASLDTATITHPALLMFRTTEDSELGMARLTVTYGTEPVNRSASGNLSAALIRFADGRPAVIEASIGQGRAILCTFPAGVSGGDLPLKAAYVPLIHQLVAYLAATDPTQRMISVGSACTLRFGIETSADRFRLKEEARGEKGEGIPLQGVAGPDSVLLRCPASTYPGIHRVEAMGPGTGVRPWDAYAANLDRAETDLTSASPEVVTAHLGSIAVTHARGGDDIARVVRSARYGREYWAALIIGALALIAVETALARIFGRRA